MRGLTLVLASFGSELDTEPAAAPVSPESWIARAGGRPAWQLWGKARPRGSCPAHPLLCHMVDVAAVAGVLLTRIVAPAVRKRLLAFHPEGEEAALRTLLFIVALHDLGKVTPAFQAKVEWARALLGGLGFDLNAPADARHHGDVGLVFVRRALCSLGLRRTDARALARAVAAHHGEFATDACLNKEPGSLERGARPQWDAAREGVIAHLRALFGVDVLRSHEIDHAFVVLLAGFTSVADWIGSMDEVFVYEPPQASLAAYWTVALQRAEVALGHAGMREGVARAPRTFGELFPKYSPWPLHRAADALAQALVEPTLVVVEAPMGEGKTEAALLLAEAVAARLGQRGLYIGLPTQATANQMLGRVKTFLERAHAGERSTLVLAHGEADLVDRFQQIVAVYDRDEQRGSGVRAESWFLSKKRTLLAEHAVGTIDQALLGVMRTMHAFVRLYGLAGKTVVLDEVHAYDTYTGTLLDRLVEWLAAMGCTVLLLSATLPSSRRETLLGAYRRGLGCAASTPATVTRYPRITVASRDGIVPQHFVPRGVSVPVRLERRSDDVEDIAREVLAAVADGGCAGWICNTVDRAQAACDAVRRLDPELPRLLLHARLLPTERASRERRLEAWLGPEGPGVERPARCVVIGTQVLEQSLDVDFDVLFSDVAPVDLVLQRAGRLHRHVRSNRSSSHAMPRLLLVQPDGAWESANIKAVAVVYAELLVRGTMRALAKRTSIVLPDDIEPLVEEVYSSETLAAGEALFAASLKYRGEASAQRSDAERRLMPRPSLEDDIFGDLRVIFDDDEDPGLHEMLRAVTRDGRLSVDIVCLVRRDGVLYADESSSTPIDLDVTPDRALTKQLVSRAIGVSRTELVRELLADSSYRPKAWAQSALLQYRRAVAFETGVATVGSTRLTLDPELGLIIARC